MKRFRRGLVVGKFSPLHFGHEHAIRRASEECEEVVLLSYSKPEFPGCAAAARERWLHTRFPQARILVLSDDRLPRWPDFHKAWKVVPHNDDAAELHRAFCADACSKILGVSLDAVYSSEDYGAGFAGFLTVDKRKRDPRAREVVSVLVDRERSQHPICGTALRSDFALLQQWTAPEVYASFVQRICILGGESSGKSALATALAEKFKTQWAAEYGRELWEQKSGSLEYEDLLAIGRTQVRREEKLAAASSQFLFCDTAPLTTLYYSLELFGRAELELIELGNRHYDLALLCAPDIPFIQDGTRRDAAFREAQHAWYIQQLNQRGIPFHLISGPLAQRVQLVADLLEKL